VDDPKADELRNKNLNEAVDQQFANTGEEEEIDPSMYDYGYEGE